MNWYKKSKSKSKSYYKLAVQYIPVPEKDYYNLLKLVDKMAKGNQEWTAEELQLQQNYSEAVEVLLQEKMVA